jgi:hypothetical protein
VCKQAGKRKRKKEKKKWYPFGRDLVRHMKYWFLLGQ